MVEKIKTPVIGFVGFSGAGKTTIVTKLIKALRAKGLSVAVIKHTHHHFDIDRKGKDSYLFREAGAQQVILGSKHRFVKMVELDASTPEPSLSMLLNQLDTEELDLILFEGFKHSDYPKIEVNQTAQNKPFLFSDDTQIIALVTDQTPNTDLPIFGLSSIDEIMTFVLSINNTKR